MDIFSRLPLEIQQLIYNQYYLPLWCKNNNYELERRHRKRGGFNKVLRHLLISFHDDSVMFDMFDENKNRIFQPFKDPHYSLWKLDYNEKSTDERKLDRARIKIQDQKARAWNRYARIKYRPSTPPPKRLGNRKTPRFCSHCNPELGNRLAKQRDVKRALYDYRKGLE